MEAKIETKGGDAWIHVPGGHVDGSDISAVVRAGSDSLHIKSQGGCMTLLAYEAVAKAAKNLGVHDAQAWLDQAQWSFVDHFRDHLVGEEKDQIEAMELVCPALAAQISRQGLAEMGLLT